MIELATNSFSGYKKQLAFTLIELMITVAIIAILSAIAVPSYTEYVKKGRRADAQAQMMDIANRQIQYILTQRVYATKALLQSNVGYSLPTSLTSYYDWDVTVGTDSLPTYTINFTAKGAQLSDGNLALTEAGVKTPAEKW